MEVEGSNAGDVTILAFPGEFDAVPAPVSERIDALIETGRTKLVFNLCRLDFVSESALGYLIKTAQRLRELDGELVLSEPPQSFQATIKTLGIEQIFKMFPQDEEAVKYFHDAGGERAGVPVDDQLLGSATMFFRMLDAPETMAIGEVLSIYEDGPTFKYPSDSDKVDIDPDELIIGRRVWIRFRPPFLVAERFIEMEAEIVMAVDLDDAEGAAKYRLRYTTIDDADRKVLERFVRERGDEGDGTAGMPARLHPWRPSDSGAAPPPEADTGPLG